MFFPLLLRGAAFLLLWVGLFLLRGVVWPPPFRWSCFLFLFFQAVLLCLLLRWAVFWVELLFPCLLLCGAARHQLKRRKKKRKTEKTSKGLVPKTGFDPPESFDMGRSFTDKFTTFF